MLAREFPTQAAPPRVAASRFTFLLGAVCWLACPSPAHADGQLWVLASVTKTLASEWRVGVDFATRWEDDVSDYSRSVLRAQAARAIGSHVWLGVGYEFTEPASVLTRREHRIWQQVDIRQHVGAWTLSHRGRLPATDPAAAESEPAHTGVNRSRSGTWPSSNSVRAG